MRLPLRPPACNFGFVILLAELDASSLAAKKKRQVAPLETATSTPKNRVWSFADTPSGRPNIEAGSSWENATGSVQYTYRNASGRAEWLSRDPFIDDDGSDAEVALGPNLYQYTLNNPLRYTDPFGLQAMDSVTNSVVQAMASGNPEAIEAALDAGGDAVSPGLQASARAAVQRLRSKAADIISKQCKGSINQKFPGEMRDKTLQEINDLAKQGNKAAQTAKKLLTDKRFQK
jgi:RHS repeat-associated protein